MEDEINSLSLEEYIVSLGEIITLTSQLEEKLPIPVKVLKDLQHLISMELHNYKAEVTH
jgi:hypothetical protein